MKKLSVFITVITVSFLSIWAFHINDAVGMRHDADAGLLLETIREKLSNYSKMKPEDAEEYYDEALNELDMLGELYAGTEEALEARFYVGSIYYIMGNFEEAIKCFDEVLSNGEEIDQHFKSRTLYFKAKAVLGTGDIEKAKEIVAELKLIEPRAANAFGKELSGTLRPGMEAPEFNTTDFIGESISLSEYKGNIIVIDFWATWCDPCIQGFPEIKRMYKKFKGQGVQFIGISQDDEIEDLKAFVSMNQVKWPQIFEGMRWKGRISKMYNVEKIPMMYVLDRENKICYIGNNKKKATRVITTLLTK